MARAVERVGACSELLSALESAATLAATCDGMCIEHARESMADASIWLTWSAAAVERVGSIEAIEP